MADDYDSDASDSGSVSGASDVMDTSFSRKRGASTVRRRYGHLGHNALYQVSDIVVVAVAECLCRCCTKSSCRAWLVLHLKHL